MAYIRNNNRESGSIKSSLDIFVPLIKRSLSKLNSQGIVKGKSINEIKLVVDKDYGLDFPIPVLTLILKTNSKRSKYRDGNKVCFT